MRILLVEDDNKLGKIIKSTLEEEGHEVTLCRCLKEAQKAIKADLEKFGAVITDIQIPIFRGHHHTDAYGLEIVGMVLINDEGLTPKHLYVHSSETKADGEDIKEKLKEAYPTAVFSLKDWDNAVTAQKVLDFVALQEQLSGE